jgi:uncharacterized repeat protein (TIGR03803 family)
VVGPELQPEFPQCKFYLFHAGAIGCQNNREGGRLHSVTAAKITTLMRSNQHRLYAAILVFTLAVFQGRARSEAFGRELAVQTLYQFPDVTDGSLLPGRLIQATDGNFSGLTQFGGTEGKGTIFRMTTNGVLSTLISFGSTNGSYPSGSLVQGRYGNLYGTTAAGGVSDLGTVFRATAAGELSTLASFNGANGHAPRVLLEASERRQFLQLEYQSPGIIFRMTPQLNPVSRFSKAPAR